MTPFLAELPDLGWVIVACIIVAIVALIGLLFILRFLQETRDRITQELKLSMEAGSTPAPVRLTPSPLEVKAADEFVTHVEFSELKADVEQIREEVKDGFRQLGDERRTSVGNLHGKIDATNEKVDEMRGEVRLLNQQLQQLLTRQLK